MSTGTVTQHQNERFATEAVFPVSLVLQPADYTTAGQTYVVCPVKANITQVYTAVSVQTAGASTLTVKAPDGTVGTVVIATGATVGTVDELAAAAANTEVEAGEVIEIEHDGVPTAGEISITIVLGP